MLFMTAAEVSKRPGSSRVRPASTRSSSSCVAGRVVLIASSSLTSSASESPVRSVCTGARTMKGRMPLAAWIGVTAP